MHHHVQHGHGLWLVRNLADNVRVASRGDEQLWPVCLRGARALAAVIRTVPAGRQAVVCSCPPYVRLVLDALGPSLNYLPADYLPADKWALPPSGTLDLVNRVREARLHACVAKLDARAVLDRLTDNSIRLASIGERMDLTRQQANRLWPAPGPLVSTSSSRGSKAQ